MTSAKPLFNRLALIGVGLIGSSIARAARAQQVVRAITATAQSAARKLMAASPDFTIRRYLRIPAFQNFPEYREPISFWSTSGEEWSSPGVSTTARSLDCAISGHQEIHA